MLSNRGFTIIELILVVIVVSILSISTIPTIMNMNDEARLRLLEYIEGNIQSATTLYQGLAEIRGIEAGWMTVNGNNIHIVSGYPEGHWDNCFRYILRTSSDTKHTEYTYECTDFPMCGVGNRDTIPGVPAATGGKGIIIWLKGYYISDDCFVYYYNPHTGDKPFTGIINSGC